MDSMTFTKAGGFLCAMLLVFLLGSYGAENLYTVGTDDHGEDRVVGYRIEVAEADTGAEEEAEPEIPFEEVFASASAADGERLWRQCSACHQLEDGANATGPHLYGVVGRDKGSVAGYDYSDALVGTGEAWTPENLSGFLLNPREYAPGTKMAYRGMADVEDRANLIAYLDSIGG
ncbi:c-type cytochrome [Jannaschia aquimarina]|uniref:CycM protein n=1 Tax=Jannaschia aquimarina TaxID=935700 RepID=A0A0D1EFL7_9RHOB|nr:cytochrome c family protein [Jannaschia aquimarina]KIT16454.1 Cytochrome c-552 [Jannaschia aquimarina]SNS92758.1 cytochrome c [Jannaschia aquimarina]